MFHIVQDLEAHEVLHGLRDQAMANCWKLIEAAIAEGDLPEQSRDNAELRFERSALIFRSGRVSYPFIETVFGIFAKDRPVPTEWGGLKQLGSYRLITDLEGVAIDDYFVLDH